MNDTNRALNRTILLLVGIVFVALGASAVIVTLSTLAVAYTRSEWLVIARPT